MYPKTLSKFRAWTKAMEHNATVGTPDYGKSASKTTSPARAQRAKRKRRRRRKKKRNLNA